MGFMIGLLYVVFLGSAVLLCAIILLQEAKGGGLAEAFGGMGAETFGVKTGGINKATSVIAAIFLFSALFISLLSRSSQNTSKLAFPGGGSSIEQPAAGQGQGDAAQQPAGGGAENAGGSQSTGGGEEKK